MKGQYDLHTTGVGFLDLGILAAFGPEDHYLRCVAPVLPASMRRVAVREDLGLTSIRNPLMELKLGERPGEVRAPACGVKCCPCRQPC